MLEEWAEGVLEGCTDIREISASPYILFMLINTEKDHNYYIYVGRQEYSLGGGGQGQVGWVRIITATFVSHPFTCNHNIVTA